MARIEHLELIQAVVNRLGRNSFAIKSTAAAATAALVALTASTNSPIGAIAGTAILPLWMLDARFLAEERAFRRLYDSVRVGPPPEYGSDGYFKMEGLSGAKGSDSLIGVAARLYLFYIPLLVLVGVSLLIAFV
ncbi:MAG: hypothetical protein OXL97_11260 [Chloroflexota bacterium]|nr:hypothetical protein [Chloroflexota bacterium]